MKLTTDESLFFQCIILLSPIPLRLCHSSSPSSKTWYRNGIFNHKVADIYNAINEHQLEIVSKHIEKYQREEQLLREVCADHPDDFDFIQECLILQKSRSLMIRKRGLTDELERHLERYIAKQRIDQAVHV